MYTLLIIDLRVERDFRFMEYNLFNFKGEEINVLEKFQFMQLVISEGIVGKFLKWQLKFDSFKNYINCEDKINKIKQYCVQYVIMLVR